MMYKNLFPVIVSVVFLFLITREAWGKNKKEAQICPQVMVYLRGKKMNYSLSEPGEYLIKVKQNENSYLQFPLVVKE